ncbi:MAG: M1 family metallopeptidase [Flavobacteriales bacterium]|jgi:leukotriene-A4 hydrolase|nr:M1 family metallopeptidase [Flavobacteriales bacterium]MBK6550995.1 M1 family metallopeptidase [Flavobacteriales bacterium]MBK6882549.1 M1 family metallopeptidase [Flavobacteriales bacterium]MBK7101230.1 M1 family metallopeptidase [Flavobacteriales bacterium]MBK7111938.1 M1 family metallopeptidase [Flavobacteriales bacterium]
MLYTRIPFVALFATALVACQSEAPSGTTSQPIAGTDEVTMDHHSNARPVEAVITHLDLDVQVDMENQKIFGKAGYAIDVHQGTGIILDTDGLVIEKVTDKSGSALAYNLGDSTMLGRALRIDLRPETKYIIVHYATGRKAKALQWLSPQQTADKKYPFLFTQGEAILSRSWIPIQDSPGIRFTYAAKVKVPHELMAVMSASNAQERSLDGVYTFELDKPVPAYLIALAVGDIEFRAIDERTGVYGEHSVVDRAAWEFADMGKMVKVAESLYGPYRWGRYDVIVLPPSFPFGGMENPCLTFATPTIIAGDRSLTALIAHELAHSWSGNLVTNATWNDFWLNEGFTVYFEGRISEALYGADYAGMLAQLGRQDLVATLDQIAHGAHPEDSKLRLDLKGRNPDDGMTDVAYEKGASFMRLLEEKVGRPKFDAFLRDYFDRFAFQSMTTDKFLAHLEEHLINPNHIELNVEEWVDGVGLPDNAPVPLSDRFAKVDQEVQRWSKGTAAKELAAKEWSAFEWMHFLRHLPEGLSDAQMHELDAAFGFTKSANSEILAAWFEQSIRNDYDPAFAEMDVFLNTVGRRKFLVPLYKEMLRTEKGRLMAQTIYNSARPNYHSVSVHTIDDILAWKDDHPPVNF